jgi:hypothetical protein
MISGFKKAALYLILAVAIWGGITPRLLPCSPDAAMACCVQDTEQCAMDVDCCQCESSPARDASVPVAVKPPRQIELPVGVTFSMVPPVADLIAADFSSLRQVSLKWKPPKIYLLNRSLLI